MAEKAENLGAGPSTPEAASPANAAPSKKKAAEPAVLPVFVEFIFTAAAIFLIVAFLTLVTLAWLTQITLFDFVWRTGVAFLGLGHLLLLLVRQVVAGVLRADQAELEEAHAKVLAQELQTPAPASLPEA